MVFKPVTLSFLPLFMYKKTLEKTLFMENENFPFSAWKHMEGKMYPLRLMYPTICIQDPE